MSSSPDELSYQDVQQQPFLLTVTYVQGLQYWAEKLNLPESPDFCPLAGSVIELRERVKEHIMFTNWDLFQGLVRVNLGAMSQWPQPSSSSFSRTALPLGNRLTEPDTGFTEASTQTASLAMSNVEQTGHISPPDRMEEENWYVLVITASIRQLDLGSADDDLGESSAAPPARDTFQNSCTAAVLSGSTITMVSCQGVLWRSWGSDAEYITREVNWWPLLGGEINRWLPLGRKTKLPLGSNPKSIS